MNTFKWEYVGEGVHALVGCPNVCGCQLVRWHKKGERRWRVYLRTRWELRYLQIGTAFKTFDEAKEAAELNLIQMKLGGKL